MQTDFYIYLSFHILSWDFRDTVKVNIVNSKMPLKKNGKFY